MTTPTPITAFQQAYAAFQDALEANRAELLRVNTAIDAKELERDHIARAAPHADDIAAAFLRGLTEAADDYKRQFTAHLAEKYVQSGNAAAAVKGKANDFLSVGARIDDGKLHARKDGRPPEMPLGFSAVAYFLRDKIAAEIPVLVAGLCPAAQQGMRESARRQSLQALEAELVELRTERDRLVADIAAARAAVIR